MPSERTWHKGPPPHIGWWNASRIGATDCWRWWDGGCWSAPVWDGGGACYAGVTAKIKDPEQSIIEWSDYWPENARVPRIDPRKEPSNAQ